MKKYFFIYLFKPPLFIHKNHVTQTGGRNLIKKEIISILNGAFSLCTKFIKKVDIVTQSKITNKLAPNKANLFCLNIFGIRNILYS